MRFSCRSRCRGLLLTPTVLSLVLVACATAPTERVTQTKDPLEPVNRVTYKFNTAVDTVLLRPLAKGYVAVVPRPVRTGVGNVFQNLGEPAVVANDSLQGKGHQALADLGRFLINSTFGLLGIFDVGKHVGLPHHDEDLGQTLAFWGVPSGPYLVLPLLGPSTLRDTGGSYGDSFVSPLWQTSNVAARNEALLVRGISTRASLLDFDKQINEAFDPYSFVRDAYIQHRRYLIFDGNPPPSFDELPDDSEDSGSDASPPPTGTAHERSPEDSAGPG